MTVNKPATTHPRIAHPKTWLFVPAMSIGRVPKAFESGADAVVVDVEDAVAHAEKAQARVNIKTYCHQSDARPIWVRINNANSDEFAQDIALCTDLPNLAGIVLAKAELATTIEYIYQTTGQQVVALVESALGLSQVDSMAKARGLYAFSYGFLDLCQDLGVQVGTSAADIIANQIRYQLMITSKVHQVVPPIDTIYPEFQNADGLKNRVQLWSQMGMSGMLCIHPNQVAVIQKTLVPTDSELAFARRVIDAYEQSGEAIFQVDGRMVDAPVIARCHQLLRR